MVRSDVTPTIHPVRRSVVEASAVLISRMKNGRLMKTKDQAKLPRNIEMVRELPPPAPTTRAAKPPAERARGLGPAPTRGSLVSKAPLHGRSGPHRCQPDPHPPRRPAARRHGAGAPSGRPSCATPGPGASSPPGLGPAARPPEPEDRKSVV